MMSMVVLQTHSQTVMTRTFPFMKPNSSRTVCICYTEIPPMTLTRL